MLAAEKISNFKDLKKYVYVENLTRLHADFIAWLDRKPQTIRAYKNALNNFLNYINDKNIKEIKRGVLIDYKNYLLGSDLSIKTKSDYLRINKQFFNYTANRGYINIIGNIHDIKTNSKDSIKIPLKPDEVRKINNSIDTSTNKGKRLYILFNMCVCCGTRLIELQRANICDLKTINGFNYIYVQGKGKDAKIEPLEIPHAIYKMILEYTKGRNKKEPLFISESNNNKGQRITTRAINSELKELLINNGFNCKEITPHSLRHTSGTTLYNLTKNIYTVQKHQRHQSVETTEIYIHSEERQSRHTEQDLYNYFYNQSEKNTKTEIIKEIDTLNEKQLSKLLDFINLIK